MRISFCELQSSRDLKNAITSTSKLNLKKNNEEKFEKNLTSC